VGYQTWVKAGQMVTSVRKLADKVGISESKVRTLLKKLKDEGIISTQRVKDVEGAITRTFTHTLAHALAQSTILTINDLQVSDETSISSTLTSTLTQENNNINNKNKNIFGDNTHTCTYAHEKEESTVITYEDKIPIKDNDTVNVSDMMDFVKLHKREWIETFCMNNQITLEQFFSVYADFVRHCENLGETVKVVKEVTSHFANWYLVQQRKNRFHSTTGQNNSNRTSPYSNTPEEAERRRKFEEHIWRQLRGEKKDDTPLPF